MSDHLDHAQDRLLNDPNGKKVSLLIFDLKYDENDGIKAADITAIRKLVRTKVLTPVNRGVESGRGLFAFYGTYAGSYATEMKTSMNELSMTDWEGINYDSNRETSPNIALNWQKENGVTNFLYSAGIFIGGSSPAMWQQLKLAAALKVTMKVKASVELLSAPGQKTFPFATYGWTFGDASSAADSLKEYGMDAVMGNMDQNFGHLPGNLDYYGLKNHKLITRNDKPPFRK